MVPKHFDVLCCTVFSAILTVAKRVVPKQGCWQQGARWLDCTALGL
jgi:hypothetical protein